MKGNVVRLLDIIDGRNKILEIPVYQRNYDWQHANIAKMFDDLVWMIQNNKKSHFFGSIVTKTEDGQEVVIIDGQQRLTSVTLLLLALRQHFLDEGNDSKADEIYETYLYNKFSDANDHYKLKPIKRDLDHYKKLYLPSANYARPSNITSNYEYFYTRIQNMPIADEELFDSIQRLEVMQLSLQSDDEPQLIFESINSTGLDLTDADKVRNLLLMNEPYAKQTEYFERYWSPIEIKSDYDVTPLIKYWLTNKLGRVPLNNRLYFEFKDYIKVYSNKEDLFEELLMYANNYQMLENAQTGNAHVDQILKRDKNLMITSQNAYYLAVLEDVHTGKLQMEDFERVLLVIENFLFRRAIVEVPTNALNKMFATLHRDVMHRVKDGVDYVDVLAALLLKKRDSGRFPSDDEFIEHLLSRDIYRLKPGVRSFLFERLENYGNKEAVDVFSGLENKTLSIEHIMPQKLSAAWKTDLGADYEDIHNTLLNSLGNLTLTGYNSEMQNSAFAEKREFYKTSHLGLTLQVAENTTWGSEQINTRSRVLAQRLTKIFALPQTDYVDEFTGPTVEPFDSNRDYTGHKLVGYQFRDAPYVSEKVWKNMAVAVIKDLYADYPDQINDFVLKKPQGKGIVLEESLDLTSKNGYTKIGDGIYLWTGTNTVSKMHLLMHLLNYLQIPAEELQLQVSK